MVRKQRRKRKHILLCTACLIILSLASCATLKDASAKKGDEACIQKETVIVKEREICSHHNFLKSLVNPDDFESALKKNLDILAASSRSPHGDDALFNIGLIYAHPANPRKDYKKSLIYFKRLLKEFPRSGLIEEAKVWTGVLEDIEKSMKVDIEIEEKKKELTR